MVEEFILLAEFWVEAFIEMGLGVSRFCESFSVLALF